MNRRCCFYCGAGFDLASPQPETAATVDHVFPRAMIRHFIGPLPLWWRRLNKVPACRRCNEAKADRHPALWLDAVPHPSGRDRLRSRLMRLGMYWQPPVVGG